jgi:hypothetical protein
MERRESSTASGDRLQGLQDNPTSQVPLFCGGPSKRQATSDQNTDFHFFFGLGLSGKVNREILVEVTEIAGARLISSADQRAQKVQGIQLEREVSMSTVELENIAFSDWAECKRWMPQMHALERNQYFQYR